jgi:signal transduction histidine kinase
VGEQDDARPSRNSSVPWWLTTPICVAVLILATVSVSVEVAGQSAAIIAGAAAALLVAIVGTIALLQMDLPDRVQLAAFLIVGLAGVALSGLAPGSASFVVVYLALAGLAMTCPLGQAIPAGVFLFAAMNVALVASGVLVAAALLGQAIGAAFVFTVGAFTRSSQLAQERASAAQARAEELVDRLRASQHAQAEAVALAERARLAREIHDVLAHALTGLVLTLDTMELLGRHPEEPEVVARMLEQVSKGQRIAREGLADTKRAIAALRGDELPGPALLDQLVRETAAATGMHAELSVIGRSHGMSPEVGLTIYRTAQEALTNSAKYAGPAAQVQLTLTYAAETVELAVQDTRAGDDVAADDAAAGLTFGGYGLAGMRERAELLGGSLTAGPTDAGFALRLELPARPAAGPAVARAVASPDGAANR